MKKKVTLFTLFLLLMTSTVLIATACGNKKKVITNQKKSSAEQDLGFESPEEVMSYFTDQISKGDFKEAVKVFPINQKAENYNLGKQMDSQKVWIPNIQSLPYPSEDKSFLQANKVFIETTAMQQIANMCFSLIAEDEYLQQTPVTVTENQGEAIANSFLLHNLETFEMTDMNYACEKDQKSKNYQENITRKNEIYGSSNFEEYEVNYRWNNQKWKGSVTLIQYGNLWYIDSLQSNLAGGAANCYLEKI